MAHIDAGKTTCAERILYLGGRLRAPGETHHGTTQLDHLPEEREKGITITSAASSIAWTPTSGALEGIEHRVQLIDTPGHIDFTMEVERSLRVLDGAVFVLDASQGVECQSETVWRQAERHGVPRVAFLNKVDKPGADVAMCLRDLRERLEARPALLNFPGEDEGIVDVVRGIAWSFEGKHGKEARVRALRGSERDALRAARAGLVEVCAEVDDDVLAAYVGGADVSPVALERAIRRGALSGAVLPVLCGSALKNRGVHPLLDAIVAYLPSPAERPAIEGRSPSGERASREPTDDAPLAALAFKSQSDKSAGVVTFVRVYSGTLRVGDELRVGATGARERVHRMFAVHGGAKEVVLEARAGAIVALSGLRSVRTGDTLCARDAPIVLERIASPAPVVEVAIEARTAADRERLGEALARALTDDPSLGLKSHPETGQTLLGGMGALHLEVTIERLRREHGVDVTMGKPEVAYRETALRAARAECRFVKQPGGAGQFAVVTLVVEPAPRGAGVRFVDETVGGVVPREFVPGVERGVMGAATRGGPHGYPVVDVLVRLVDGAFHVKDSSAAAFEIAGSLAFQRAIRDAGPVLLEPRIGVEVNVPASATGAVTGELAARRAIVRGVAPRGERAIVTARAPLATMFDWVSRLRGITGGRGSAVTWPDGYDRAPSSVE